MFAAQILISTLHSRSFKEDAFRPIKEGVRVGAIKKYLPLMCQVKLEEESRFLSCPFVSRCPHIPFSFYLDLLPLSIKSNYNLQHYLTFIYNDCCCHFKTRPTGLMLTC